MLVHEVGDYALRLDMPPKRPRHPPPKKIRTQPKKLRDLKIRPTQVELVHLIFTLRVAGVPVTQIAAQLGWTTARATSEIRALEAKQAYQHLAIEHPEIVEQVL